MAIYRGTGSASSTSDQATIDEVTTQATNAANSATSAASSASSAASSASSASSSATSAATSATTATNKASEASASASAASASAGLASTSETNASDSETAASLSASQALASANNASAAQTAAETAETNAATSASSASTSASTATSAATTASTAATTATTKAAEASTSETNAATSETNAATSASSASTSATNASTSETNAATSASNASTSETNAATSETNAATSASSASTSATTATTKASEAATSASNASTSETNAATSASNASTSETNAANSATAAQTAQTNAETAETNAEAALDEFTDLYLGVKSSAPTLDNDGDALQTGALYYDSTAEQLYIWDGSAWDQAAFSVSGAVTSFNTRTGAVTLSSGDVTTALGYTPYNSTNPNSYVVQSDIDTSIANLVDSAPTTLDTLNELAAALGDDANFSTTVTNSLATKAPLASPALTGTPTAPTATANTNTTQLATTAYVQGELANEANWNTAYGWGDHSTQNYAVTTGDTMTGNLSFGDNDKAIFGAGSDLQIYHDGSNSYVQDTGTGNLRLLGTNWVAQNGDGSKNYIFASDTSGVTEIYYDGSKKLATTNAGIDVTGTVTADGLTVDGNQALLSLYETDTTDENTLLRSGGGDFSIRTLSDNGVTVTPRFNIDHATGDISFYEDTGTTPKLFWDASAESLGIGTSSPSALLEIAKNDRANGATLRITNSAASSSWTSGDIIGTIDFYSSDSSDADVRSRIRSVATAGATSPGAVDLTFSTFSASTLAERMRIDSSGNVGIGLTPTSGGGGKHALDVDGPVLARGGVSSNQTSAGALDFVSSTDNLRIRSWGATSGTGIISFRTGGGGGSVDSEAMRIDSSGNLLVGKTSLGTANVGAEARANGLLQGTRDGGNALELNRKTSDGVIADFRKDGTTVGSVSVTSSGTTYNTTSDARLKTDIQPIADATDRLMQMNPVSHKWKADPEADAVVGFIAQEMQEIVPEAVSGDADSDEMMSMDYGRITPVLVAALQEATKEIQELKARVAELEAK